MSIGERQFVDEGLTVLRSARTGKTGDPSIMVTSLREVPEKQQDIGDID